MKNVSKKQRNYANLHNLDDTAWKLAEHLLEDFSPHLGSEFLVTARTIIRSRNIKGYREMMSSTPEADQTVIGFKTQRQILDLFKKFSFHPDAKTAAEVLQDSKDKFLLNQARLDAFTIARTTEVKNLLMRARGHCSRILGDFDKFEVMKEATFGKKSSVGIPMHEACEGARYDAPISGSCDHIIWFDKLYSCWNRPAYNYAAERAELLRKPLYMTVDTLKAVLVNKTWKSKRLIMPNTTLGTLYSGGLGAVFSSRLRDAGYDIRLLQEVHGELARFGSITGTLVTADQSMASDNIILELVDEVLERKWADACKLGRIEKVDFYNHVFTSKTFMTMGIGFTFPLQTLVFLSLLLAIRDMVGLDDSSVVSVYGDDLIYDVRMHDSVMSLFPLVGLVINADKTFAEGHFRESCGYDYFRGFDVRPFHLKESEVHRVPKLVFESFLYQAVNGLRRRWQDEDIPQTLSFLGETIKKLRRSKTILVVPPRYPDFSGVRLAKRDFCLFDDLEPLRVDVHGTSRFSFLAFVPLYKKELRHAPYLFKKLRSLEDDDPEALRALSRLPGGTRSHGRVPVPGLTVFIDRDDPEGKPYGSRNPLTGKRERKHPQVTMIPERDIGKYRERTGVTGNWT